MAYKLTLGGMLLLTSALVAPAAHAQPTGGQTPAPAPPSQGPAVEAEAQTAQEQPAEEVDISIPGADLPPAQGDELVVVGQRGPASVVRRSSQVLSVLSTEDIARSGEGDIAGALQRVTGLSVAGNGFVFVRGLGERYSLSLLNGSPLPSPDPLRRVVPLDIFPTSIVASALVQKSFSPNFPGEFGGGVINLTTEAIPDETFLEISGSISGDTFTTFNLGYTYYGGDLDWLGYDDGARDTPDFIRQASVEGTTILPDALTELTNGPTTLLQTNRNIPANWSAGISAGTSFAVADDVQIGVIGNLGISNSWTTRDALQQLAVVEGDVTSQFRTVLTDNRALVNGLLGLGVAFGEHEIRITNVYIHDTVKQGRLSRGYNAFVGTTPEEGDPDPLVRQGTYFFERELYDLQGVAEFDFGDIDVDLRGTYARSRRNSPYERDFSYSYNSDVGDYVNRLGSSFETATIVFSELDEQVIGLGADVSYRLPTSLPIVLTGGWAYTDTERDSTRNFFRYRGPGNSPLDLTVGQLRPDFLLSDYTILTQGIRLVPEAGLGASAYSATLNVQAGYVQADIDITDTLRASGGVRFETADQAVTTNAAFAPTALSNDHWLPALTLTWSLRDDMQVRLHGSKTIARPQFRELAPQQYEDFESDRSFFGNPFLTDSELTNFEARYEWYMGRDQRLSLAGFYKQIDRPIEAVVSPFSASGDLAIGFSNAPSAELYGAEFEFQRYFPLENMGGFFATRRLLLIGNYTYTQSALSVQEGDLAFSPVQPLSPDPSNPIQSLVPADVLFDDGDPLVGQSDHLVNLQVGIEDTERLSQYTVLLSYASERVTARGPEGFANDFVEEPGLRLDFVGRQAVRLGGVDSELKVEVRNILGTDYSETLDVEGNQISINSYEVGTTFSLGLSVRF